MAVWTAWGAIRIVRQEIIIATEVIIPSTKSKIPNKSKLTNEAAFNRALALLLNGRTEVSLPYNYGNQVTPPSPHQSELIL